jgi:hypothetical protein
MLQGMPSTDLLQMAAPDIMTMAALRKLVGYGDLVIIIVKVP